MGTLVMLLGVLMRWASTNALKIASTMPTGGLPAMAVAGGGHLGGGARVGAGALIGPGPARSAPLAMR